MDCRLFPRKYLRYVQEPGDLPSTAHDRFRILKNPRREGRVYQKTGFFATCPRDIYSTFFTRKDRIIQFLPYNIPTMIIEINRPEDVGIFLKSLRTRYKVSQKTLAKGIGISQYSIIRYEKNDYLQASESIIFNILSFFTKEYVKKTIHLSIIPNHDTTKNSGSVGDIGPM